MRSRPRPKAWSVDRVAHTEFSVGFVNPEDQRFGPFFEKSALELKDGVPQLPTEAGQAAQRWQFILDWKLLGPFPAPVRKDHIEPQLPELIRAKGAYYVLETDSMPSNRWIHPDWAKKVGKKAYSSYTEAKWYEEWIPSRPKTSELVELDGKTQTGRYEDMVVCRVGRRPGPSCRSTV